MSNVDNFSGNGAKLEIITPGYNTWAGIRVSERSEEYHGLGQEIDGSKFTAQIYIGKVFIKLEQPPPVPVEMKMKLELRKSLDLDGSENQYFELGSVEIPHAEKWFELHFQLDVHDVVGDSAPGEFKFKFYTSSMQLDSYLIDQIYLIDSTKLIFTKAVDSDCSVRCDVGIRVNIRS